ncbi:hypothetical protein F5Y16DRAFT_420719 [Xylariaceae sp. FL0255]|nr:hypothetical protein F5Y16DRAFT_420719 [Xylariaceae sp. FL0255]
MQVLALLFLLTTALIGIPIAVAAPMMHDSDSGSMDNIFSPQITMNWTISNATRQRQNNNTLCVWSMVITDVTSITSDISGTSSMSKSSSGSHYRPLTHSSTNASTTTAVTCEFQIVAPDGEDCGSRSFEDVHCKEPTNTSFRMNGGHSEQGFIVMVLVDDDTHNSAFFGFSDAALDSGAVIPPQTISVLEKRESHGDGMPMTMDYDEDDYDGDIYEDIGGLIARHDNGKSRMMPTMDEDDSTPGTTWEIQDMLRILNFNTSSVLMSFSIMPSDTTTVTRCDLKVDAPVGTDLNTWEWYDQQCMDGGYSVSWGYMYQNDAGIMTLISPLRNERAFFGFTNISLSENLVAGEASVVLPCDC